jgi:NAD(P)-dependent dehydrogenase (short-subunit alcohol dehydrogenase family)
MSNRLSGQVAIVTGAAAGIGRAAALLFAREGARVVLSDVDGDRGDATARQIRADGGDAQFVRADVSRDAEAEAIVRTALERYGRLDCAFNNAGIEGAMADTAACTEANWDRTLAINLKGVWLCMRHQIPAMLRTGGGSIVNMASVAGLVGFAGLPAYVASKHGVVGLSKSAALELADKNIRVNVVCPGVIHTEMIDRLTHRDPAAERSFTALEPVGRMGTPEEVAAAALWLCSRDSSFVTGATLAVDGGFIAR